MGQVNRSLPDPMMDDIDHALGRPRSAFGGYRNHYAADRNSPEAARMAASPYWMRFHQFDTGGPLVCYRVTKAGREALHHYLVAIKGGKPGAWEDKSNAGPCCMAAAHGQACGCTA